MFSGFSFVFWQRKCATCDEWSVFQLRACWWVLARPIQIRSSVRQWNQHGNGRFRRQFFWGIRLQRERWGTPWCWDVYFWLISRGRQLRRCSGRHTDRVGFGIWDLGYLRHFNRILEFLWVSFEEIMLLEWSACFHTQSSLNILQHKRVLTQCSANTENFLIKPYLRYLLTVR